MVTLSVSAYTGDPESAPSQLSDYEKEEGPGFFDLVVGIRTVFSFHSSVWKSVWCVCVCVLMHNVGFLDLPTGKACEQ